ncbi:uncharacterized protein THITE_2079455 [Thermothielavioides terrestris NRRL 8126]|uniref:Uncharacterized protein n=1 Tax=Thermothielavioides terrestris (strain ATCC 38088 / NRRL 8126) TaxID=578455 RepID=G2R8U8_THETT|nr:uncharacterized protein THITE_2079455 [Thermothielavioides terrestris NRRL 8126]AEO68597.1 hypothetical protein THITE_2079455 [Thermothielavioides terrestris NRRL 8126]
MTNLKSTDFTTACRRAEARTDSLLLFGPQFLTLNADVLHDIRSKVRGTPDQEWIVTTISSLPDCWNTFVTAYPQYAVIENATQMLAALAEWFQTEPPAGSSETKSAFWPGFDATLPNLVLSPLVVIAHLTEYMAFLDLQQQQPQANRDPAVLGFCTGLFSAFVAALAGKDRDAVREHGETAVRLAMLVGGIVDAQGVLDSSGPARALATSWASGSGLEALERILNRFPESYVSVAYDENRATVTTAAKTADEVQREMRAASIVAQEIGLRGRFHNEWYRDALGHLLQHVDAHPDLRLPDASMLVYPAWSNAGTSAPLTSGALHAHALRAVLVERSEWHRSFESAWAASIPDSAGSRIICFGPERCIPPSAMRKLGGRVAVVYMAEETKSQRRGATSAASHGEAAADRPTARKEDDIAVIGMSIKVAGADDVDEFWDLLCHGSSQHQEVPADRLSFDNVWREADTGRKWFGNFIRDHDAFDHKFFKKSAREIASTDPQQRHMMQVAYQALEQSGYFASRPADMKIGCFVGVCSADYENNAACYQPNAYTAIGNLKSFIAGKISHYFGWEGPSMCIDSACSSSLVAVHQACRAILGGECSAALAGGANIMTNSLWFQNLAAASFLSPTGQCKPFDAKGDGYCRAEGFAAVFLKKMSQAIQDGDQILGTISSTAVYQNQNCTPVFVPNSPSLADLFRDVVNKARLSPRQITVVEAHGTGTQVGDPAEYHSIKAVLGGDVRPGTAPLALGSVKGLVGHTECSSGAVSLVKTLLMLHHKTIPPQASFDTINPAIGAKPADHIEIVTKLTPWRVEAGGIHAALINNYGASGSNASAVVTEAPQVSRESNAAAGAGASGSRGAEYPLRIFGHDERALKAYCERLRRYLAGQAARDGNSPKGGLSLPDLAFNLSRQGNPTLDKSFVFGASSVEQVVEKMAAFEKGQDTRGLVSLSQNPPRPVVLCFGGQVSTFVGLDRGVYDACKVFRAHLNECDAVCVALGKAGSIFPGIFQREPISDPVKLQTMLFATQYACARSWMDCGVEPVAVVGHSFGELVALCISGVLSLRDALKMVIGRAAVIRESWGPEKGAMMAVEGDQQLVESLLAASGSGATIACFNGPRSFTLAGTAAEIDAVAETLNKRGEFSGVRFKRLNVTNAFHSTLVEPLIPQLIEVGEELTFHEPRIPLEMATEVRASGKLTGRYVADHMRKPVYFNHAVRRLAQQYPSCVFLEAGSNSTITNMASRALESPKACHFQPVNITSDGGNGLSSLTNATLSLWREGLRTTFWPHHRTQTYEYAPLLLPPYQFEKSRHWLEMKAPPRGALPGSESATGKAEPETPQGLFSFVGYQDKAQRSARFRINTATREYLDLVSGHLIAKTAAICPATLIVDMAIEALTGLRPELSPARGDMHPQIHEVRNQAPICIDESRTVLLDFDAADAACRTWDWKISSSSPSKGAAMVHVTGRLVFVPASADTELRAEFKRYERLTGGHRHCANVLEAAVADDVMHGARSIYRAFADVVDYAEPYRGLQRLVGRGQESAGRVVKKHAGKTWLDTHLSDCFSQVAGIWVNCMTDCSPDDMYIATGFEKWLRSPVLGPDYVRPETWDVLACHQKEAGKLFLSDVFIFDAVNGNLVEAILGINYHGVSKLSMSKTLARLTPGLSSEGANSSVADRTSAAAVPVGTASADDVTKGTGELGAAPADKSAGKTKAARPEIDVAGKIRIILADISGLEPSEIKDDAGLADIGIDSLMGMELGREMEGVFKTPLMSDELAQVTTFRELVAHVSGVLGLTPGEDQESDELGDGAGDDSTVSQSGAETQFSTPTGASTPPPAEADKELKPTLSDLNLASGQAASGELRLPPEAVFEAFEEVKKLTDQFIADYRCADYMNTAMPKQTQLCVALAVEAFEQLGCPLASARAGTILQRIEHRPEHARLVEWLYQVLEHEARLVDVSPATGVITRTAVAAPATSSEAILAELLPAYPDHEWANRLTYFAGRRLAEVLRGEQDGIKLIFGTDEGRELVTGLYGDSLLNKLANVQMQHILERLVGKLEKPFPGPLKVMELGAGTGGTTKGLVPLLDRLGVPVEYTFTDLSASFVAAARKKFSKQYPFMKFRVHDIEKEPAADLLGTQHIVVASNAIHATRSLATSVTNIRKALRPDGFLMMLEMTEPLCWVDMIFGLFEGWWLFDDGRRHAIAHQSRWRADLEAAGYGRIDWTDGWRPETEIQRVFVAQASVQPGFSTQPTPMTFEPPRRALETLSNAQKLQLDAYVSTYTQGFEPPTASDAAAAGDDGVVVAVTGATGSLGAHLVAHLASLPTVKTVYCLNRRSTTAEPTERQLEAFTSRGIQISRETVAAKLRVVVVDSAKPKLGLDADAYRDLVQSVTHIVHNAWPMTGKRPVSGLEAQFHVMRNLIDLARDAASCRPEEASITFQLISSIAVMGHYSLVDGNGRFAPEVRAAAHHLLPNGYAQAKWVCERMLDETLHRYPARFRPMVVRPGQIAGNSTSGYWNPVEHLSFLVKSSQTLRALPALRGDVCWTPVDRVAGAVADLLLLDASVRPHPVYHIDNPVRQPWEQLLPVLGRELGVPPQNVIGFDEWVRRVRRFPGAVDDNPAARLIDFLDDNFVRMSCGGLLLETRNACEHSPTLRAVGPVGEELVKRYVDWWKETGFLHR